MSDSAKEHEASELEELVDDTIGAAPAPGNLSGPVPVGPPPGPGPAPSAHKQLYQFLWGGIAILFGCLLPFHDAAPGWVSSTYNAALSGPLGFQTVGGSIVAFCALLFVAAQWHCIKTNKVMLGPILLIFFITFFAWRWFLPAFDANDSFIALEVVRAESSWTSFFHRGDYFAAILNHVGPGHLFLVGGSTYIVLVFILAIVGVGEGKKKTPGAGDPGNGGKRAASKGRGKRR